MGSRHKRQKRGIRRHEKSRLAMAARCFSPPQASNMKLLETVRNYTQQLETFSITTDNFSHNYEIVRNS
jgi:hypothetical protein